MSPDVWCHPPDDLDLPDDVVDVWRAEVSSRDQAREILRRLLGRYLAVEPEALSLKVGTHGKPEVIAGGGGPGRPGGALLRFNISHTKGLALYAFAHGTEVGVDVERARSGIDTVRMARRFIGPEAGERLESLELEQREREFLRAWVRYEAAVKCVGTGIGARRALAAGADPPLWVEHLDPGESGVAAAVAVAAGPRPLRRWRWERPAASGR